MRVHITPVLALLISLSALVQAPLAHAQGGLEHQPYWTYRTEAPTERLVLASLTRLLSHEPSVTGSQVSELLAERGIAMGAQPVTEALRRLVERDIVREVRGQPPRYGYKVELVRLWVERYKALGRVVEEVG